MPRFYRILEHISDAFIEVRGRNLEEAFGKAALAMTDIMVKLGRIEGRERHTFEVRGRDLYKLLYNWLEAVLLKETNGEALFRSFDVRIEKEDGYRLSAEGMGEPLDIRKHRPHLEVKAVTYHLMEVIEEKRGVRVRFLLDL